MPKKVVTNSEKMRVHPAIDPESREKQMIAAAENLAYKQICEGTASSQIIVHYLKLGTERAMLEKEKLAHENELLKAKTSSIEYERRREQDYEKVIAALRKYQGVGGNEEY